MSLQDLHARMLWDAASKGGSQADIARRYNEALQYLLGDYMSKTGMTYRAPNISNRTTGIPPELMSRPSGMGRRGADL